jgi:hypothetical protein
LKYLIIQELEKPYEENMKKVFEIEKERKRKGISLEDAIIFPNHAFLTEWKWFMIVETDDPMRIAKWEVDHMTVKKFNVIPIIESSNIYELMKDRWSHVMT